MKVNFIKKFLILCCAFIAVAAIGVGFGFADIARADGTGEFYAETAADIRLSDPMGLRFTVRFDETVKNDVVNNGKTLGVIAVPYSYVELCNDYTNAHPEYTGGYFGYFRNIKGKMLYATFAESEFGQDATSYFARLAITGIKFNNLNLDFAVIGFIAPANGDLAGYRYTAVSSEHAKNIGALANAAIDSGDDFGAEANAYLNEIKTQAALNADGVIFNTETNKYEFNGNEFDNLAEITTRASYTVKHVKIVNGEEQEISSETIENTLVGSTVNLDYIPVEGFMPQGDYKISGTVLADGSLTLTAKYAMAVQIANSENKATLYAFSNGQNLYGNTDLMVVKGTFGGQNDVYKLTSSQSYTLRIMGVDKNYLVSKNYEKLCFDVYTPNTTGNLVLRLYNDESTPAASLQIGGEITNNANYIRIYDSVGRATFALTADTWYKVEVNTEKLSQLTGLTRINLEFSHSGTLYLNNVQFSAEPFMKNSIKIANSDGKAYFTPIDEWGRVGAGYHNADNPNYMTVTEASNVNGETTAYKVSCNPEATKANVFMRIYGVSPEYIFEKGIKSLRFKIYYQENYTPGTDSAARIVMQLRNNASGNIASSAAVRLAASSSQVNNNAYYKIYDLNGQVVQDYVPNGWYTVSVNLSTIYKFNTCPLDNVNFTIYSNTANPVDFYLTDMEFSTSAY